MADVCFIHGPFYRQYGVATSSAGLNSHIQSAIITSTNANLYTGALAAGDVKVSKDGGAEANIGTLPTQLGATGIWIFALSAAELSCATLTIHLKKGASTAEQVWTVETNFVAGRMDINATALGGNTPALNLTSVGTGNALALNSTTAPYQTNLFTTVELAEVSGAPGATNSFGAMIQYLFARFFQLVTQTSTTQSIFKKDSTTALTNETVADDGVTQSKGKAV